MRRTVLTIFALSLFMLIPVDALAQSTQGPAKIEGTATNGIGLEVTGPTQLDGPLTGTSASFSGTVAAPAIVPTNITPSTSPICANGTGGALTTMGCGGAGVTQIIPGTNVTISPSGGTGAVTINSTGAG
jgi:hypothetical protein